MKMPKNYDGFFRLGIEYLESGYKVNILTPSPTPPLKGGAILLPSPLRGEGKGEGVQEFMDTHYLYET